MFIVSASGCQKPQFWQFFVTVCKTVRPMLSDCCLSCLSVLFCLSVTLVYCGQTVGRIQMKLGKQVGLGSGHIALDVTQVPLPKGAQPPNFRLMSIVRKGLTDEDSTAY